MKVSCLLLLFAVLSTPLWAEKKTYIQSATQIVGSNQTVNEVRPIALLEAKRLALEQAGTYVESITVSENFEITRDEVLSLTAGILETRVINEDLQTVSGAIKFTITIEALIELADLEARIRDLKENGTAENDLLEENKEMREKNAALEEELKRVKAQLEGAKSKNEAQEILRRSENTREAAKIQNEINEIKELIQRSGKDPQRLAEAETRLTLLAKEAPQNPEIDYYLQKIAALKNYSLDQQIEMLEEAIKKDPQNALSRLELSRLYFRHSRKSNNMEMLKQAIAHGQFYIRLQPDSPKGYLLLASYYRRTGETKLQEDILKACLQNVPNNETNKRELQRVKQMLGYTPERNPRDPQNNLGDPQPPQETGTPANVQFVDPPAIATAQTSIQFRNYTQGLEALQQAIKQSHRQENTPQKFRDLARLFSTQAVLYRFINDNPNAAQAYQAASNSWDKMGIPHPQDYRLIVEDNFQMASLLALQTATLPNAQYSIVEGLSNALYYQMNPELIQKNPTLAPYYPQALKRLEKKSTLQPTLKDPPPTLTPLPPQPANVNFIEPPAIANAQVAIQHKNYAQASAALNQAIAQLKQQKNPPNKAQIHRDLARLCSTDGVVNRFMAKNPQALNSYNEAVSHWEKMGIPHDRDYKLIAEDYFQVAYLSATLLQQNPQQQQKYRPSIIVGIKGALKHKYNKTLIQNNPLLAPYFAEATR